MILVNTNRRGQSCKQQEAPKGNLNVPCQTPMRSNDWPSKSVRLHQVRQHIVILKWRDWPSGLCVRGPVNYEISTDNIASHLTKLESGTSPGRRPNDAYSPCRKEERTNTNSSPLESAAHARRSIHVYILPRLPSTAELIP